MWCSLGRSVFYCTCLELQSVMVTAERSPDPISLCICIRTSLFHDIQCEEVAAIQMSIVFNHYE